MRKYYAFIASLCLLSFGLVAASIILIGTPAKQRALQLDEMRLSDFSMLSSEIGNYYVTYDKLPASLDDLEQKPEYMRTTDPETNTKYSYKTTSDDTYDLCTTFSTASKDNRRTLDIESNVPYPYSLDREHKKGYDCISYTTPKDNGGIFKPVPVPGVKPDPETLTN